MSGVAKTRPVALITGSSSGIGAAVARHLAATDCDVVLNYRGNEEGAESVRERCIALGGEALAIKGDVAEDADCRRLVSSALKRFGQIDYLVNNAGTTRFAEARDLDALNSDDFARIFAVNVTGAYQMSRAARPALQEATGSIVNVSSHAAFSGLGSSSAYAASKAALNTLTLALARALAPHIRVNAVCPGFVDTEWMYPAMGAADMASFKTRCARAAPLRMLVGPNDVAEAVSWLARRAKAITGQLLVIDAGTHLAVSGPIRNEEGEAR